MRDRYGNHVITASQKAVDHYDRALLLMRRYEGDPLAALDAALAEDPYFSMAWAVRAELLLQQTDRALVPEARRSIARGKACAGDASEAAHLDAAERWAEGQITTALNGFADIVRANPKDMAALQTAHLGHFFVGDAEALRDLPGHVLKSLPEHSDGRATVLGMAAFGLEETGDYSGAEVFGHEAVALDPRDAWSVHAVAHVYEMRGDPEIGLSWLNASANGLSPDNGFIYHNWWHLALLHLDRDDHRAALDVYDTKVRPDPTSDVILEWIDASALLWRLHLDGVDTGNRFALLADCWERAVDDRIYAFNDLHAVMAFLGAGRMEQARRSIRALEAAATEPLDNGVMARTIGLPLATGFLAFAEGRYEAALDAIGPVVPMAHGFGGSHAQRDVLELTALHAALRGGHREAAHRLAEGRLDRRPKSLWAKRLMLRAATLNAPGEDDQRQH